MRTVFFLVVLCFSIAVSAAAAPSADSDVLNFTRFITKFYQYYSKLPVLNPQFRSIIMFEFAQLKKKRADYKDFQDACNKAIQVYSVQIPAHKPSSSKAIAREISRPQFSLEFAQPNLQPTLLKGIKQERDLLAAKLPSPNFLVKFLAKVGGVKDPANLATNVLAYLDSIDRDVKMGFYDQCSLKIGRILKASEGMGI